MTNVASFPKGAKQDNASQKTNDVKFKQQYNSKLRGKFDETCHDIDIQGFKYNSGENFNSFDNNNKMDKKNFKVYFKRNNKIWKSIVDEKKEGFDFDTCFGCRNYYVCGLNMRMRIEYGKKGKRRNNKEKPEENKNKNENIKKSKENMKNNFRNICIECLICGLVTVYQGVLEIGGRDAKKLEISKEEKHFPLNTLSSLNKISQGERTGDKRVKEQLNKVKKGITDKKKKKKSMVSLKSMLEEKRMREGSRDAGGGQGEGSFDISGFFGIS